MWFLSVHSRYLPNQRSLALPGEHTNIYSTKFSSILAGILLLKKINLPLKEKVRFCLRQVGVNNALLVVRMDPKNSNKFRWCWSSEYSMPEDLSPVDSPFEGKEGFIDLNEL